MMASLQKAGDPFELPLRAGEARLGRLDPGSEMITTRAGLFELLRPPRSGVIHHRRAGVRLLGFELRQAGLRRRDLALEVLRARLGVAQSLAQLREVPTFHCGVPSRLWRGAPV
jgi:hypothetical protein